MGLPSLTALGGPTTSHLTPTTAPLSSVRSFVALVHFISCSRGSRSCAYLSSCFWMAKIMALPARPEDGRCVRGNECPPICPTRSSERCSLSLPRSHASASTLPDVSTGISGLSPRPAPLTVSAVNASTLSPDAVLFTSTAFTPELAHALFPPKWPCFSSSTTRPPRSSIVSAADNPASPPPMTTASTTGAGGAGGAETLRGPRPIAPVRARRAACRRKRSGLFGA
mmetsp:Transcript_58991/g.138806  ORF Transcript_58991/g.138806 Transcript_58991/m.138806 type:complete len:226 (+) Transcript_58991:1158-1835(+)